MSEATYAVGSLFPHKGEPWRVVRIITKSITLFEKEDGTQLPYIMVESYIELKSVTGLVDFIMLSQEREEYTGDVCIIKGIEPINWQGVKE